MNTKRSLRVDSRKLKKLILYPYMGLFKESIIDVQVKDEAWEHEQHTEPRPDVCSSCYSEKNITKSYEIKNEAEENNLEILKARIKEKREQREKEIQEAVELIVEIKRILLPIPEVTEGSLGEFSTLRHTQLCQKVDTLYHNYLVSIEQLLENLTDEGSNKIFQDTIKELSIVYEDLLLEGLKIRW